MLSDGLISGSTAAGTPKSSRSSPSHRNVARWTSGERQAFEGSVSAPHLRRNARRASTRCRRKGAHLPRHGFVTSCHARRGTPSFGAEKVELSPRPVIARTAAASGRPANTWRHCRLAGPASSPPGSQAAQSRSTRGRMTRSGSQSQSRQRRHLLARRPRRRPRAHLPAARQDRARPSRAPADGSRPNGRLRRAGAGAGHTRRSVFLSFPDRPRGSLPPARCLFMDRGPEKRCRALVASVWGSSEPLA